MLVYNRDSRNFACIYKLTCLKNGLIYIGQTTDFGDRVRKHGWSVRNYERKKPKWSYTFATRDGATNFEKDYKMEVVEYVDSSLPREELYKLLDSREQYWIEYFHSNDPEIGFNHSSGGQFKVRSPINAGQFKWHGFNSSLRLVYDMEENEMTMYNGFKAIAETYNLNKKTVKDAKRDFVAASGRFYIVDTNFHSRTKKYNEIMGYLYKRLDYYLQTDDQAASQTIATIVNRIDAIIRIEKCIFKNFNYDGNCSKHHKHYMRELKQELYTAYRLYAKYAVSLQTKNYISLTCKCPVSLYDTKTNEVTEYESLDDALEKAKLPRRNLITKMRKGSLIGNRYYVYFKKTKIADIWLDLVKQQNLDIDVGKSRYYKYFQGYLKTRKHGNHLTFVKKRKMHK